MAKKFNLFSPLLADSKIFEKLDNNILVDHLEKSDLFSNFQYGFRSSDSTADCLIVVFDRIARAFNVFGATWALALDVSKAFDRVWNPDFLHIFRPNGISG